MERYITVLGFSILHCFQAVTLTDDSRNSSVYILPDAKSWLEGFNACNREKNASDEDYGYKLPENKTYIAELVSIHGPLWTYGLEVIFHQNGKTKVFQIHRRNPNLPAVGVCSLEGLEPAMSIDPNRSYTEAETACHKANTSIPIVTPTNIILYATDIIVRSTFWVAYINEELFLNDQGIDVRCLLYDSNGDIKTDNCKSKHKTLCISENALPVVKYVANVTLPRLPTESSKGTSSSINNTHSSKNTNDKKLSSSPSSSSTPSSSSRTKSDIFMDPQIQFTMIGVGSAIVIAIIVAICVCCCCKRQQNPSTERQSTTLAVTYSETMDSMAMKEQSIYETPNNSEYATPDDAIRKARQRQSIGENEYDVINAGPAKKKPSGVAVNAYNHVTLVSSKDEQNTSDMDENQYDVTNYGRQAVLISPNDTVGNEYGHVDIKVER